MSASNPETPSKASGDHSTTSILTPGTTIEPGAPFSRLQLVEQVDDWPYYTKDPEAYKKHMQSYYYFRVEGWSKPLGYIHNHFISQIPWPKDDNTTWSVNHFVHTVTLRAPNNFTARTKAMNETLHSAHKSGQVPALKNHWGKNELFPLLTHAGPGSEHILDLDGSGADIFGIISYSVHLVAWVMTSSGRKIYVPRRSHTKMTHPKKLDSTVGGSLASHESPIEGMIRKCKEELCLDPSYTRANLKPCGTNSFQMTRTDRGEPGCQQQVQYLYEMELRQDVVPRIGDGGEVGEIHLISVDELQKCMANGEVKSSCNLVYLAFLIRHGYVTAENEPDFVEICSRMQRRHYPFFV